MRIAALIVLPLALAGCQSREVISICTSVGDPSNTIASAFHDADGLRLVQRLDVQMSLQRSLEDTLAEPVLPELWRLSETTLRSLPETEPSPCNLDREAFAVVIFADGSQIARRTTCRGNALDRVATEILAASAMERLDSTQPGSATGPDNIAAFCEAAT